MGEGRRGEKRREGGEGRREERREKKSELELGMIYSIVRTNVPDLHSYSLEA